MYQVIIFCHSLVRWLVLASLIFATYRAYRGYVLKAMFSWLDNTIRSWTISISHAQLLIGMTLYFQSPVVKYFWGNFNEAIGNMNIAFFGIIHPLLMLTATFLVTIGSSLVKRKQNDREKFRTMLTWFAIALLIVLVAVPWPFSPLANRPYLR